MQTGSALVIVTFLSALVCSLIDCGTAATIKFNGRQIDPEDTAGADSDFDFNSDSDSNSSSDPDSNSDSDADADANAEADSHSHSDSSKQPLTKNNSAIELLKATRFRYPPIVGPSVTGHKRELTNVSSDSNDQVVPTTLIRKIASVLGKRPPLSPAAATINEPNKQLFGGRLPPIIERIIQRIQNYFSVYNPPEYFDSNRPPTGATSATSDPQHSSITLICSNSTSGSISCNDMNSSEEQGEGTAEEGETLEMCDGSSNSDEHSSGVATVAAAAASSPEEYNVVVTHTIVQDSSLNVYSPPTPELVADSTQMVSNVVVILEPAAGQYSPPPLDNTDKNKFYVYVNPTKNQQQQQQQQQQQYLKTWNENGGGENFQPNVNTTYTVIIRGDTLQEFSGDLQNASNSSFNPEIAIYLRNSTKKPLKKCKTQLSQSLVTSDCEPSEQLAGKSTAAIESPADQQSVDAKSNDNSNKVPNINLMLVPPNDQPQKMKNKSCANNKNKPDKNPQLEYYVLKPDNGNANKGKTDETEKPAAFYLQKTSLDAGPLAHSYLPPPLLPTSKPKLQLPISASDAGAVQ